MRSLLFRLPTLSAACVAVTLLAPAVAGAQATCARTLTADVVALDQVFFWNRLGAVQPQGMMFALRRDVVPFDGSASFSPATSSSGPDKRPRPLVLRMNVGRLPADPVPEPARAPPGRRGPDRHAHGLGPRRRPAARQLDRSTTAPRSGANPSEPGRTRARSATYTLYAEREGEHVLYSAGATAGGEGDGGQINAGLFGAVIVEPAGALWYRSQVTRGRTSDYATTATTAGGYPVINYDAVYPAGHRAGGAAGAASMLRRHPDHPLAT